MIPRMSLLCLVRHGQASADSDDYDLLSPIGEEQSHALGAHWATTGRSFDRVYVGPLRRHRQTYQAVAEEFRDHGLDWPEPTPLPELDEHHGPEVIAHHKAALYREAGLVDPDHDRVDRQERIRRYLTIYQLGTRRWIHGNLKTPSEQVSWADFRAVIATGIDRMTEASASGQRIAAFTSGGATAAIIGLVLGLCDDRILDLSWRVRNGALTEILFSEERLTLDSFNATPHLAEERLMTFV